MKYVFGAVVVALIALAVGCFCCEEAHAQEVSVDLVTEYVWRGTSQGDGAAIQPSIEFELDSLPLVLGVWGSTPISGVGINEIDLIVEVPVGEVISFSATSYYLEGSFDDIDNHDIELGLNTGIVPGINFSMSAIVNPEEGEDMPLWAELNGGIGAIVPSLEGLDLTFAYGNSAYAHGEQENAIVFGARAGCDTKAAQFLYNADTKETFLVGTLSF